MQVTPPRGIAVVDVGYTNAKLLLFTADLALIDQRAIASRHVEGPPYRHLDPEPVQALLADMLPAYDRMLPLDVIVCCGHGAAMALVDAEGGLALPVMDYQAEPPPAVVDAYRAIEPRFAEVVCPLLPMALTQGLQVFWQEQEFPRDFGRVRTIMPYVQYAPFRLSGARVSEVSSISCQSQLVDPVRKCFSSLAIARGWDRRMAPLARAWDTVGSLKAAYRGDGFRGHGRVVAGVHDSNANYLRYLAAGIGDFTLLSTGTWIISFDPRMPIDRLDPTRDTASNTDVFGRLVATSRFFGGRELEIVSRGAPAEAASLAAAARLVAQGSVALPAFTDSGGPLPGLGGRGHFTGPEAASAEDRASLAALYCALMVDQQLAAVEAKGRIVVDGPFTANPVFLALLAGLRAGQPVQASALRDGTAAGAAVVGLMNAAGGPVSIGLTLRDIAPAAIAGLDAYRACWLAAAQQLKERTLA